MALAISLLFLSPASYSLVSTNRSSAYHKNVLAVYDVTGEFDAMLIAKFKDTTELDSFIKDLLREPGVQRTYTQTVLNIVTEDHGSSKMV